MKRLWRVHGKANEGMTALEKELEELRLKPAGSELAAALNKLAYHYLHSNPDRSEACALEAKDLAKKLGLLTDMAKSCSLLGSINHQSGNYEEAMLYSRKSMRIYEELEDKNGIASTLSVMARIYWSQGMIDKALEHYHGSLRGKQECGAGKDELALCHLNLGACYSGLLRLDLALSSYAFAEKILEESGDRKKLAYLYNNIGSVYGKRGELDKAREYFQKALEIRENLEDKNGIASTLSNLGSLQEDLGNNESALSFFIRSLELFEEMGNKRLVAYTCGSAGGVCTRLGLLDKAEELITRGLEITRKLELKDWEILCLKNIANLYETKGDLRKALMHSRELNTCMEKHLNEKSMDKIAGLQVQFETEKKEKEAEIYRLKNVELLKMNDQLREAFVHVRTLQGMLPICANCKKVRDDDGYWQQIESYISEHSDAKITHGICPECMIKLYGKGATHG
ncbi:MAG: tetratricopeptide repeat protein [Candidatus Sabulitectum sp.]|nr:tetratricopeptide repeat protein [Candidatus Sabulitectum sp.]